MGKVYWRGLQSPMTSPSSICSTIFTWLFMVIIEASLYRGLRNKQHQVYRHAEIKHYQNSNQFLLIFN